MKTSSQTNGGKKSTGAKKKAARKMDVKDMKVASFVTS